MSAISIKFRESDDFRYTNVLVDGEVVAFYRKRSETYTGIGLGTYTYFDVYKAGTQASRDNMIGSDSTRKRALADALAVLGLDDAARQLDSQRADHYIMQRERQA